MNIIVLAIIASFIVGCSPSFQVTKADNRFSENKNSVYLGNGNRISEKTVGGGFHADNKGVYIDPFIEKNTATGKIELLGFHITNTTLHTTMYGGANELGLIKEVTFRLQDGEIINLKVTNQGNKSPGTISYNPIGNFASYDQVETGMVDISKESFEKLASATRLSCKISGSERSVIYEEDEVEPEFLVNLKNFYKSYVL